MTSTVQKRENLMAPLVNIAAVLGIIQGAAWIVLSLSGILVHTGAIKIHLTSSTNLQKIGNSIFFAYIEENPNTDNSFNDHVIVGPGNFSYILYVYLILSAVLFVASSLVLWASLSNRGENIYDKTIATWTVTVVLLCLLDLILFCLILHDYIQYGQNIEKNISYHPAQRSVLLASVGIVMTLAARGYVLWLVNLIFATIIGKYFYRMYTKGDTSNRSVIDAYITGSKSWLEPSVGDGTTSLAYDNRGFNDENEDSLFASSAHLYKTLDEPNYRNYKTNREIPRINTKKQYSTNNNNDLNHRHLNKDGSHPYHQEASTSFAHAPPLMTAKIGRQGGGRSPPLNVGSPYIPDPDYY